MARTSTYRIQRSGSLTDNATEAAEAMDAFADSAKKLSPIIVMARDGGAIVQYVHMRGRGDHSLAMRNLQDAVSAKLIPIPDDEELSLSGRGAAKMRVPVWQQAGRDNQSGKDPFAVARRAAAALREDGQWIAVAFREPNSIERRKWAAHMDARGLANHHTLAPGSVLASFTAGGSDAGTNRQTLSQIAAVMPGFDEITTQAPASASSALVRGFGALLGLMGLGILAGILLGGPAVDAAGWLGSEAALAWASKVPGLLALAGTAAGVMVAAPLLMRALSLRRSSLPVQSPRFRTLAVRDPKRIPQEGGGTKLVGGRRPLRSDAFMLSPAAFVGLAAPHVGSESGANSTKERPAPAEIVERVGVAIGVDHRGQRVHLPAQSSYEGTAIAGAAGKGKSQLQAAMFAFQLMERMRPSGIEHFPGRENATIFFDTKGDTWQMLMRWCQVFGVDAVLVHAADNPWMTLDERGDLIDDAPRRQNSATIDVLYARGSALDRARYVADMMKQSLDEGAVQGQSLETLTKAFTGAFALTGQQVKAARAVADAEGSLFIPLGDPITPVSLAWAFLGDPDFRVGELLYAQLRDQAQQDAQTGLSGSDAQLGAGALASLYGPDATAAVRRSTAQAPRNKLALMQGAAHFWDLADHRAEVGSFRPGSRADALQREQQARVEAESSRVAQADGFSGFTAVVPDAPANPFAPGSFTAGGFAEDAAESGDGAPLPAPESDQADVDDSTEDRVFTWDRLLREHRVVIVNSGVSPLSGSEMTVEATRLVSSITFFALANAIRRTCRGWRSQGRRVTVMADELSMIADDNVETIEWLRDKGRSFGVELNLATQRQNQLVDKVRRVFLGFGTFMTLVQDDKVVADEIAENIGSDGSAWSGQDVVNLPLYSVILRTRTDQRLPATTVRLEDFESRREQFEELQEGHALLSGEAR